MPNNTQKHATSFLKNRKDRKYKQDLQAVYTSLSHLEDQFKKDRTFCEYSLNKETARLKLKEKKIQGFIFVDNFLITVLALIFAGSLALYPFFYLSKLSEIDLREVSIFFQFWDFTFIGFLLMAITLLLIVIYDNHITREYYKDYAIHELEKNFFNELVIYSKDSAYIEHKKEELR